MASQSRVAAAALSLLAAALIAGCAGGPRGAAAIAPPAQGDAPVIQGAAGPLALSHWPAGEAKAVLLALHGYGDYAPSTFGRAADFWTARGIEVFAYDQRGFGRNPSRMQWPGADALIADLAAAARAVKTLRPDLPLFVMGHSMGGGVALAAAGEGRLGANGDGDQKGNGEGNLNGAAAPGAPAAFTGIDGLILLAPAVWGGDRLGLQYRASAWMAAQLAPDARWTGRGLVTIYPTDNLDMLRALSRDPLHFAAPSGREFMGLIRIMDRAVAAAANTALPVLVVQGARDEVIPESSVRAMFAALPGPADFAYVQSGWHMLLRDLQAERVWRLTGDWILDRAAPAPTDRKAPTG